MDWEALPVSLGHFARAEGGKQDSRLYVEDNDDLLLRLAAVQTGDGDAGQLVEKELMFSKDQQAFQ